MSHPTGALECTVAGSPGTWAAVSAYIHGSLVVTNSIAADKITAGTLSGFSIKTAASGSRIEMGGSGYVTQIRGFDGTIQRITIDATAGTVNATGSSSGSSFSSGGAAAGVSGTNSGLSGSAGPGVSGSSLQGYGGNFTGNATRPPINIASSVKPTNSTTGGIMIYNVPGVGDRLCYCLGGAWYYLATNTPMP